MKTSEIIDAVFDVKTNGELNEISEAIRDARKGIALRSRHNWFVGQEVNVIERSRTTRGTITKVNRTRCVVKLEYGSLSKSYNVPMTMLEAR